MARTLLSGANIVYNGNPLSGLSLTSLLDKFMEKKPKTSTWHGGSEIEPAKKMDISHQLIGPEILSLAETDVPAEDLVFHKFYANKLNSSKKPKKKKGAEDEDAEELFDVDDDGGVEGGDESDNEEIENLLDAADMSAGEDGEYDYDDLDKVAAEDDDEDLVGDADDDGEEVGIPSTVGVGAEEDKDDLEGVGMKSDGDDDDDDDSDIAIGEADDGLSWDEASDISKGKGKKAGASPFASLEDYEHLLKDNDDSSNGPKSRNKMKTS